jgi:class 3 adenylate cyclase
MRTLRENRNRIVTETTTATVLFTDVVGSVDLRQLHGETVAHQIMSAHETIVRSQIAEHAGQEIKTTGDSFMVAFDSARKAVECAVGIQRELASHTRRHPGRRDGAHRPAHRRGDPLGPGPAGQQRRRRGTHHGQAEGEQILVSDILKAVLGARRDLEFKDHKRCG